MDLYPLLFRPRFVEKIWGGRKFQEILGKDLPAGKMIGESWELYDFPPGVVEGSADWVSAEIANGGLAGRTLHWAVQEFGADLLGNVALVGPHGQFPILIKFLDAREDLSVQVHPDEKYAASHPGAYLKTEAWYVMQNDPGAKLYKGLPPGVSRQQFEAAIGQGNVDQVITLHTVKPGQCYYLPSGTVHALGAGILVAEVQTPSDTTYRVFDFNRIDPGTGKTRALHVQQALECIDFSGRPEPAQPRSHVAGHFTTVSQLVSSPYFKIEKVRFSEGIEQRIPYDQPVVWMMLEGQAEIRVGGVKEVTKVQKGETLLLPAKMKDPILKTLTDCVWLEVTFPAMANRP